MTDIDPRAELELHGARDRLVARIPLDGPVGHEWLGRYDRLALAADVPVRAVSEVGRAWLVLTVRTGGSHDELLTALDAARALIFEADAAAEGEPARNAAEATIRGWWAQRHDQAGRVVPQDQADRVPERPRRVVRTAIGAERRLTLAIALGLAVAVLLLLPRRFSFGPNWIIPVVEVLLLVGMVVADRRAARGSPVVRTLSFCLILVLVAAAAVITGRLVIDLVEGGPETSSAVDLLRIGSGIWLYTILAFAFLYWLLDGGGPEARILDPAGYPDLAFPQHLNPDMAAPGWRPVFGDYLYLAFTNATAFSPTDVMPLARWAKGAMTVQAITSLAVLGLVIARAVNIFR